MNLSALLKITALCICIAASTYVMHTPAGSQPTQCSTVRTVDQQLGIEQYHQQCQPMPQHSWFAWFSGESRSPQFHFIDLLELLNRFQR